MKRPDHTWVVVTLIALLAINNRVEAWDWLTLYPTKFDAVLRFDGTDRNNDDSYGTRDTEWQAGVRVNQQGYILDPSIAWFQLEVEPVYTWGKFTSKTDPHTYDGDILSYLVQLNLLQGTPGPFSYNLSAMHTRNFNSGSLGGRYLTEYDAQNAAANWKNTAFPVTLKYEERSMIQDYLSGQSSSASRRDEQVKTLSARGRSSKMDMLLERQSVDDRVSGRDQDFDLSRADLTHRLPWGSGSQLRSRLYYYDRTGFNPNKRLTIEEIARIQHSETVFSRSAYRFFSVTQDVESTEHSGEFEIHHQLYNNLSTSVRVHGSSQRSDPLDQTIWRTGLESQYHKQDLFGIAVNAGFVYSYQKTDRDSRMGLVEVIDEAYVATLGGAIILTRRFIIAATIIVTNPDGTLVYEDGFDYTILNLSDDLTQLQIIPGGRISPGDTMLVSHKAQVLPSQEFSTTFTQYNLGFNLGWARFSHHDRKSDEKLISGAGESFLNPYRNIITQLEFKWEMGPIETLISAERHFNQYSSFESDTLTYRQLLTWTTKEGTLFNLNAIESFTEATNLDTDLYSIELVVNWQPFTSMSVRPRVGAWRRYDRGESVSGGERTDEYITAGLTLRWWYRKINFDLAYDHNRRTTDSAQTNGERLTVENRLMFNLLRKF